MSRREVEDWIADLGGAISRLNAERGPKVARQKGWEPRIDVFELEESVLVRVELAGVAANQLALAFFPDRNTLSLRGERSERRGGKAASRPIQLEIEYGEFFRDVSLPEVSLSIDRAQAELRGGMLTVILPKSDAPTTTMVVQRTITIKRH